MANTTSGTATFDKTFAIDEIVEDAFERIGLQNVAGYQLKSARRSLNILFQEWGNRGIHYWEIDELDLDLIEGQAEYDFFRSSDDGTSATSTPANVFGMSDVLEAQLRSNRTQTTQSDSPMTKVDRSTYAAFSNKLSKGKKPNFSESVIQLETAPGTVTLSQPRNGIFSKLLNLSEVQLAGDLPEALRPCSFSPSQITAKASEPKPQPVGSTTVRVIADAMAASIAFPPFAIICIPACAASG